MYSFFKRTSNVNLPTWQKCVCVHTSNSISVGRTKLDIDVKINTRHFTKRL